MPQDDHCEPAASIIAKLGGSAAVADILGVSAITVRRRRRAAPSGDGGIFPDEEKVRLIEAAELRGVPLTWDDFKPVTLSDTS